MSFGDYLENELLDHVFGGAAFTAPSSWWVQLHTGDPGDAGGSNIATETDRRPASFGTAASGTISSSTNIVWTNVAASETYSWVSVWDSSSTGNELAIGQLSTAVAVTAGDTFTISAGDLDISLD